MDKIENREDINSINNNLIDPSELETRILPNDALAENSDDSALLTGLDEDCETVRISEDQIQEYTTRLLGEHPTIKIGSSSILGTRDYQQDSLFSNVENGIAVGVVCDGMGGLEGGEIASQKATLTFAEDFYNATSKNVINESNIISFLKDEAEKMNEVVSNLKNDAGEYMEAGTTVVSAVVFDNRMYWMSVGDSRIYLIRDGKIVRLTRDHNLKLMLDEQLKRSLISKEEYDRKIKHGEGLISFLGIGNLELIDTNENGVPIVLQENDIVLLCSDGLYKRLSDEVIADTVWCEEPDMVRAARRLTDVVLKYTQRSQDNTSIVLMQYNKYLS
ncbi:protein phosphatase [Eubacterium ruminantium]|nr:protein phosphatase [Eubacterium ruminantium]